MVAPNRAVQSSTCLRRNDSDRASIRSGSWRPRGGAGRGIGLRHFACASAVARAPRLVAAAVVVTVVVAMGVSVLFALFTARLTGIHPATLVLATAPGGIAEMAVTAQVLELGVPMVTSFHVTRVMPPVHVHRAAVRVVAGT